MRIFGAKQKKTNSTKWELHQNIKRIWRRKHSSNSRSGRNAVCLSPSKTFWTEGATIGTKIVYFHSKLLLPTLTTIRVLLWQWLAFTLMMSRHGEMLFRMRFISEQYVYIVMYFLQSHLSNISLALVSRLYSSASARVCRPLPWRGGAHRRRSITFECLSSRCSFGSFSSVR